MILYLTCFKDVSFGAVFSFCALRKHAYVIYCNISRLKKDIFQMKNCDSFLNFAQNIRGGIKKFVH